RPGGSPHASRRGDHAGRPIRQRPVVRTGKNVRQCHEGNLRHGPRALEAGKSPAVSKGPATRGCTRGSHAPLVRRRERPCGRGGAPERGGGAPPPPPPHPSCAPNAQGAL